jgi:hypothetical protein
MSSVTALRAKLLEEIQTAAAAGDSGRVLAATNRLSTLEDLARRQAQIDSELAQFSSDLPTVPNGSNPHAVLQSPAHTPRLGESPRARGDRLRLEFVRQLNSQGHRLIQIRGALFRNRAGEHVGIAYANERKDRGWFLGLPEAAFHNAALLLESRSGRLTSICLPMSFFTKYGKQLSKSQGQVKFNVSQRGTHFVMPIPGAGQVSVDEYVNNYAALSGSAT